MFCEHLEKKAVIRGKHEFFTNRHVKLTFKNYSMRLVDSFMCVCHYRKTFLISCGQDEEINQPRS